MQCKFLKNRFCDSVVWPSRVVFVYMEKSEQKMEDPNQPEWQKKITKAKADLAEALKIFKSTELVQAAQDVQKTLNSFSKKNPPGALELDKITLRVEEIGDYARFAAGYEKDKEHIHRSLAKHAENLRKACKTEFDEICKKNPKLGAKLKDSLLAAQKDYLQKTTTACAAYAGDYLLEKNVSFRRFHEDRVGTVHDIAERAGASNILAQDVLPATPEITAIEEAYQTQRDALLLVHVGEDVEASKSYIKAQGESLLADLLSEIHQLEMDKEANDNDESIQALIQKKREQYNNFKALYQNALATIEFFHDANPKDAAKRAFVLAHFADVFTNIDEHKDSGSKYLDATLALTGYQKDDIAEQLGNSPRIEDLSDREKQALNKVYAFDSTEFRMDGTGVGMVTLAPLGMAQLVDTQVYIVKNDKDEDVEYIRVRFNSQNGPIGFMPKKDFDFEKVLAPPQEEKVLHKPVGLDQVAAVAQPEGTTASPFEGINDLDQLKKTVAEAFRNDLRTKWVTERFNSGRKSLWDHYGDVAVKLIRDPKYANLFDKLKADAKNDPFKMISWAEVIGGTLELEQASLALELNIPQPPAKPQEERPKTVDNKKPVSREEKDKKREQVMSEWTQTMVPVDGVKGPLTSTYDQAEEGTDGEELDPDSPNFQG